MRAIWHHLDSETMYQKRERDEIRIFRVVGRKVVDVLRIAYCVVRGGLWKGIMQYHEIW